MGKLGHKFKLGDKLFTGLDSVTQDEIKLKLAVENFIEKMEIVSHAIIQLKKFRVEDSEAIKELQEKSESYITVDNFRG